MCWPSSFAYLLLVCRNWGVWTYNLLYAMLYGYDDWSLIYLLSFGVICFVGDCDITFSILSQLVQLEIIRESRKDTLILQGESRNVQKFLKYPYSRLSKLVIIWTSFAEALVVYLPGQIFSEIEMVFLFCCVKDFVSKSNLSLLCFSNDLLKFCKSGFHSNTDAVCPVVFKFCCVLNWRMPCT